MKAILPVLLLAVLLAFAGRTLAEPNQVAVIEDVDGLHNVRQGKSTQTQIVALMSGTDVFTVLRSNSLTGVFENIANGQRLTTDSHCASTNFGRSALHSWGDPRVVRGSFRASSARRASFFSWRDVVPAVVDSEKGQALSSDGSWRCFASADPHRENFPIRRSADPRTSLAMPSASARKAARTRAKSHH